MLFNTFLRDEGDPSASDDLKDTKKTELGEPKPNADPQGGDPPDPSKKEGLSAEEKELKGLKEDKTNLERRLSDTQESFRSKSEELKGAQKQVHDLKNPPPPPDTEYASDSIIQNIDQDIARYKENAWDDAPLQRQKDIRKEQIKQDKSIMGMRERNAQSDDMGKFLMDNPGVDDLTPAGKAKGVLTERGEKVSIETAHYYQLGKSRKEDFEKSVQAEVKKQLEAEKKANGARGQEGGYEEPPSEENKEMEKYADEINAPGGFELL